MEKNLLAEKVISLFRTRDTHTHRNVKFMTINEDGIRELFDRNAYLQELSAKEAEGLQQEMKDAEALRLQLETEAKERAASMKKQSEIIRQSRVDEKLKQDQQTQELRKKLQTDSRKANAQGADVQKTLKTFHASNMATAKAAGDKMKAVTKVAPVKKTNTNK